MNQTNTEIVKNRSEKIDIATDVHIEDSESLQSNNKRNFGYNSIEVVA